MYVICIYTLDIKKKKKKKKKNPTKKKAQTGSTRSKKVKMIGT